MIALLIFSVIASAAVWWAGRKDAALDPRLTTLSLALLAGFPLLVECMPKISVLPRVETDAGFSWRMILGAVWAAGFVFSLVRLLLVSRGISKWREGSEFLESIGDVEIRMLDGLHGPVAAGVFRKIVFVPKEWHEWDDGRKAIVLDHELAHHLRRDPLRRWIAGLAIAVNWFNPLVRWMVGRLLIQCEFACDMEVLRAGAKKESYAQLLCDMADETRPVGPVLAMAEKSGLEMRVRRMMSRGDEREEMGMSWLILLAVGSAGLLAILGAETVAGYTRSEIEWRRTADPFPGNGPP